MHIFSQYHQFANIDLFLATFNRLAGNQRVSADALSIPNFCTSVRMKLNHSETHLKNMLAIEKWDITPSITPPTVPPYATTGSASNATATIPTPAPSTQASTLALDLDGFFECLTSALDIFAHVINRIYFTPPRPARDVGFYYIVGELTNDPARRNEAVTQHLARMIQHVWFAEMKLFRRYSFHYGAIPYEIEFKPMSYNPIQERITFHDVLAIRLPDDPFSLPLNYRHGRSVQTLCVRILKKALDKIDFAYGLLETRIRTANQVPV